MTEEKVESVLPVAPDNTNDNVTPMPEPELPKVPSLAVVVGETAFTYADNSSKVEHKVTVNFHLAEHTCLFEKLFNSAVFVSWARQFEDLADVVLTSVVVLHVHMVNDEVVSALVEPVVSGDTFPASGPIYLRSATASVGVLVMLRCYPPQSPEVLASQYTRDYVLFASVPRLAIAAADHFEIMKGDFDENDEFICHAGQAMSGLLNVRIYKQDLVSLTRERVMSSSPETLHDRFQLYLYRQNVTDAQLQMLPKASVAPTGDEVSSEQNEANKHLRLTSLGEAWKMTTDAESMAALFLFHEFRYHRVMPKYRPPRDSKQMDMAGEKRKPVFIEIGSLDPHFEGVNLRVKVYKAPDQETPVDAQNKVREVKLTVGDATGIINMKLEGEQLEKADQFSEGACVQIQNARIHVSKNFMHLTVTKWSKVVFPTGDDDLESDFNFTVEPTKDMSAIEYELVPADGPGMAGMMGGMRGGRGMEADAEVAAGGELCDVDPKDDDMLWTKTNLDMLMT
eukprot:CAMPEP_0113846838 /NCGR_PEP_ID=MMETSP0372-20130328/1528_1 /TAXON_ID=340204 /ORGANISM="Lankesteria abbotti" /LENGTH=509 /DNA_ID=CAMNT_0000816023 /DNA_START=47 /DNA_END=1577 /DNA_ORIENTATION=- /assembly_acc=CAM_ASM_000359